MHDPREPFRRNRVLGEENQQAFREAMGHEHQVREALQARRASGYKVRWRVAWAQVVAWLIVVAVVGGILLLLIYAGGGH